MSLDDKPSCPECGSYAVIGVTPCDDTGVCEYRCDDCGEYFTAECEPEEVSNVKAVEE